MVNTRLEDDHRLLLAALLGVMLACIAVSTHEMAGGARHVDGRSAAMAGHMLAAHTGGGAGEEVACGEGCRERYAKYPAAPGYALVLYATALADERVAAAVRCHGAAQGCGEDASFASVYVLQFGVAGLLLVLVFVLALRLSGSREAALLTLILVFVALRFGDLAGQVRYPVWTQSLMVLVMVLSLEACRRPGGVLTAAAAGCAAGVYALFVPAGLTLAPALAVLLVVLAGAGGTIGGLLWRRTLSALGLLVGALVPLWLFRYAAGLSYPPEAWLSTMALHFSERAGFNDMGVAAWFASLVRPVPFLESIAPLFFSDATLDRLGNAGQTSYAALGRSGIYTSSLAASHDAAGQLGLLVERHVLGEPFGYLWATVSVLWRGLLDGTGIVGLVGIFHVGRLLRFSRADGHMAGLAACFGPLVVLVVSNSLLTTNPNWQNPAVVVLYAYAIAYVVCRFPDRGPAAT